jgi:hypothetical protein
MLLCIIYVFGFDMQYMAVLVGQTGIINGYIFYSNYIIFIEDYESNISTYRDNTRRKLTFLLINLNAL